MVKKGGYWKFILIAKSPGFVIIPMKLILLKDSGNCIAINFVLATCWTKRNTGADGICKERILIVIAPSINKGVLQIVWGK